MHCYAQKKSNLIKFCDHVIKTSLNDDLGSVCQLPEFGNQQNWMDKVIVRN